MSLVPVIGHPHWQSLTAPMHLGNQHFGLGMNYDAYRLGHVSHVHDHFGPAPTQILPGYYRPWHQGSDPHGGKSTVNVDKDGFHFILDVQHFSPEDITVKYLDNHVVVEAKHDETPDDHGSVSRHFVRRYLLPNTVNADALQSTISSDGVLTITAPKLPAPGGETGRAIPITHTGVPAVTLTSIATEKPTVTEKPKK